MNAIPPIPPRVRGLLRWSARAFGLFVVLVHVELLAERLLAGELTDPGIALRWAGSAVLLAGFLLLRRRMPSMRSRRAAVAFWTLVLVVHLAFLVPGGLELEHVALAPLWAALPKAFAGAALIAALAGLLVAGLPAPAPAARDRRVRSAPLLTAPGFARLVPPRAPPL